MEAQYDISDARLTAREDVQDARQDARDARTDAVFSAVASLIGRTPPPPLSPAVIGSSAGAPTPNGTASTVVNQNTINVNVDGARVAEVLDTQLVTLDAQGRSLGSYRRQ